MREMRDDVAEVDEVARQRQAEAEAREARNRRWVRRRDVTIVAIIAVLVVVALGIGGYAIHRQNLERDERARDVAELASTGNVANARAESLAKERRDLATIDDAMRAAGLDGCPDPGPDATAYQVSSVVGECRGALRSIGELEKRGVLVPGVRAPDPAGGAFPAG